MHVIKAPADASVGTKAIQHEAIVDIAIMSMNKKWEMIAPRLLLKRIPSVHKLIGLLYETAKCSDHESGMIVR